MDAVADQKKLIDHLARALELKEGSLSQFETHISRVLVAGGFAYKFKKALRLPFLDFSTLDARRFYCLEECRLNSRLAPAIYIDVVPVTGDDEHPLIGGAGTAIEYAVRMRAFDQQALWSFRIAHGLLEASETDDLAQRLARFHLNAAFAPPEAEWGASHAITMAADETLGALPALVAEKEGRHCLHDLQRWEAGQRARLADAFPHRKAQGFVRECHGDLHCGNVLTVQGRVQIFDCIEFNDSLRWIDVMNDLAFIHMDLAYRGRPDLAARLLNRYLEITGDYRGLSVLPYYRVHRALVRAKVSLLRACQPGLPAGEEQACRREGLSYLAFACRASRPGRTAIMITHGYSGSGKTTFSRHLVELLGAIQVRSDVERKRLHGIPETGNSDRRSGELLYGDAATQRTYQHLVTLAREIVAAGWPVVVDAACLRVAQRELFKELAAEMKVPFFIFDIRASAATMAERLVSRGKTRLDASDAGVAVLEWQQRSGEPLTPEESAHAIAIDAESGMSAGQVRAACMPVLAMLGTDKGLGLPAGLG